MRVKFGSIGDDVGIDSFYLVRPTLEQALANGWVRINIFNDLGLRAVSICNRDLGFNPLYDDNGFLAGAQIAQPVLTVTYSKPPRANMFTGNTNEINFVNGVPHLTSTFLLVDPKILAQGGRTELGGRIGHGLWLRDTESENGYWEVPTDMRLINTTTLYKWQNCIPAMGLNYYYNLQLNTMNCDNIYPWSLTAYEGSVSGIGYQMFSERYVYCWNWYENVTAEKAKMTIPHSPKCLVDYVNTYGVTSIHIYFIPKPWDIKCNQATDSVVPIPGL